MDYRQLLIASNPFDRLDAWFKTKWILDNNVLTKEDLIGLKEKFLELLNDSDETVRLHAWQQTPFLLENGIIDYSDIDKYKTNLILSLKDGSLEAWLLVNDLYLGKIITKEDVDNVINTFISMLKGNELDRIAVWSLVPNMLKNSLISAEIIMDLKKYVLDLLDFDDYNIQFNVLFLIVDLYRSKVITRDEIQSRVDKIKEIMSDERFNEFLRLYEKNSRDLDELIIM
ncbi:hypothetical protein [Acidianus brierleyi]|uniref:Uncharacterized protein n=1 Tax=Acidianus brierleyi TaxID=41673 RepID=A0A2U9IC33_9CREN|nr:hypothetical protein [Acidianus brierleyi]AWR93578.1 hypothetical protein DFR85_02105 [Acidianus brierleyi]